MMDLNTLELFVAVAETNSFSVAARKLGVPKSTVSRGVARLERELGVTLINRTTRQVSLSTAGEAMLEKVAPRLALLKTALGELPERDLQPSGRLRVTAPVDVGGILLPPMLAEFNTRFPRVSVEVTLSNRLVDLVEERIDLAFRAGQRLQDSSLIARRAGTLTMRAYASPEYVERKGLPRQPRDLAAHEWVVFRPVPRAVLQGPVDAVTVELQGRLVADDLVFVRGAARSGAGLALLPSFLVDDDLSSGALVQVLPRFEARTGALWVLTPGGQLPKRTVAFREFALKWLKDHPPTPPG